MRRLARACIAAATALTALAGCVLITGGTGGYSLAAPEAGICGAYDAASLGAIVPITCSCASSADCTDGGARFCCFGLEGTASVGSTCQAMPCDGSLQLCQTTKECVDAECTPQTCSYSSLSIPVFACGSLDGCAP
jgi:hypothetical protein